MTPEERIELHDQWLLSMESNHSQFAANLAALEREMQRFREEVGEFRDEAREQISEIREILLEVVQHQANLSSNMATLAEQHRKLEEAVEQYIRFRSNGSQSN